MQTSSSSPPTVIGVCIPSHDAHVSSGRRDRKRWGNHDAWPAGFESLRPHPPSRKPSFCKTSTIGFRNDGPRVSHTKRSCERSRASSSRLAGNWPGLRTSGPITAPPNRTRREAGSRSGLGRMLTERPCRTILVWGSPRALTSAFAGEFDFGRPFARSMLVSPVGGGQLVDSDGPKTDGHAARLALLVPGIPRNWRRKSPCVRIAGSSVSRPSRHTSHGNSVRTSTELSYGGGPP